MLSRLAEAVATGATSAVQLVERSIERIARFNPTLGAVTTLRESEARREAQAIDEYVRNGGYSGALAGIPMLAKDIDDVVGLPTTFGSRWYSDAPPALQDSLVVARLRAAGAIVIGKTNIPEFCIEGFTDNLLYGPTRNPWNVQMSPGGSSGGSAAALAAGLVPIATGTDGGGSVRIPAAFCGLLGFKPTNGVIGNRTPPEWIDFSTHGLMASSVEDLRTLLNVCAGGVYGDPTALPVPLPAATLPTRLVAADRTDDLGPLPPDVADAFHHAAELFADMLSITIQHRESDWFFPEGSPDDDWFILATAEHATYLGRSRIEARQDELHPSAREFLLQGLAVSLDEYLAARRRRFSYIARLDAILGQHTWLLTPTVAVSGIAANGAGPDREYAELLPSQTYSTAIQNMTGLPAISLPAGVMANGVPFGLQITAPRWADLALLDAAGMWWRTRPWALAAPDFLPFD